MNFRIIIYNLALISLIILIYVLFNYLYSNYLLKIDVMKVIKTDIMSNKDTIDIENNLNYSVLDEFFNNIQNEEFQKAYDMVEENIRDSMFNNDVETFKKEFNFISNNNCTIDYTEISSIQNEKYSDIDVMIRIYKNEDELLSDMRVRVRTYTSTDKPNKIYILTVNMVEEASQSE